MNGSIDPEALENAEEIIERFGGIRPMSTKTRVPVTTIQGWKKRNVIPGQRRDEILEAAAQNNVDLSDLVRSKTLANENGISTEPRASAFSEAPVVETKPYIAPLPEKPQLSARGKGDQMTEHDRLMAQLRGIERRAVVKSSWISTSLILVAMAAGAFLLWPAAQQLEDHSQRIATLESDVKALGTREESFFDKLVPDDLEQRFGALQEQARTLQATVGEMARLAENVGQGVLGADAGTLSQRVAQLEEHVQALADSPPLAGFMARIEELRQSASGQETLSETLQALKGVFSAPADGSKDMNETLAGARAQNEALQKTFEGVSNSDLQAAALLVGLSQFRQSLNRDQAPLQDDLGLLRNMIGEDNPELKASLDRLAPYAESGVLTPDGLSREFRSMAGDIVVASLRGEDVSFQEKAKARMNELFSVKKDGELLTGTETQARVARADSMLQKGDVEGALRELNELEGPAAASALPFIEQAQATLQATEVKQLIGEFVRSSLRTGGGAKYTAGAKGFSGLVPSADVVRDQQSGVTVLPQQ